MEKMIEKARSYAEENVINVLKEAFAKVYADGYRAGYKDREDEIPVDLRDGKTEFIDLGLPSGTLWSADYEKKGDEIIYVPLCEALEYNLPTNEQCFELYNCCSFIYDVIESKICCIGPNGKSICFSSTGYREIGLESSCPTNCFFWIQKKDKEPVANTAAIGYHRGVWHDTRIIFPGYKLPIRLVKTK